MEDNLPWCIIINANTCKRKQWMHWEALFKRNKLNYTIHTSYTISEVSYILSQLLLSGNRYFLFAGGDGTLHHGGNLLIEHAGDRSIDVVISVLPCGSGNDWVRTFGIPKDKLINSLKKRNIARLNLLHLEWPDGTSRYVFNMVGAALDAAVVSTIDKYGGYAFLGYFKYPFALVQTLINQKQWPAIIKVDEKIFAGEWLTIEYGFGKYCGGGMLVLPHATFDQPGILLMKPKSLFKIIASIRKLYNGKINEQKEAVTLHGNYLEISNSLPPLPIEADGEWQGYGPVKIRVCSGILNRLVEG